jgi:hypothetical protein
MTATAPQMALPCDSPVTDQEDMISGFRCEVAENCSLLGNYTASSGNLLPGTVRKYHYALCNNPEERSSPLSKGRLKQRKKSSKRRNGPAFLRS